MEKKEQEQKRKTRSSLFKVLWTSRRDSSFSLFSLFLFWHTAKSEKVNTVKYARGYEYKEQRKNRREKNIKILSWPVDEKNVIVRVYFPSGVSLIYSFLFCCNDDDDNITNATPHGWLGDFTANSLAKKCYYVSYADSSTFMRALLSSWPLARCLLSHLLCIVLLQKLSCLFNIPWHWFTFDVIKWHSRRKL